MYLFSSIQHIKKYPSGKSLLNLQNFTDYYNNKEQLRPLTVPLCCQETVVIESHKSLKQTESHSQRLNYPHLSLGQASIATNQRRTAQLSSHACVLPPLYNSTASLLPAEDRQRPQKEHYNRATIILGSGFCRSSLYHREREEQGTNNIKRSHRILRDLYTQNYHQTELSSTRMQSRTCQFVA